MRGRSEGKRSQQKREKERDKKMTGGDLSIKKDALPSKYMYVVFSESRTTRKNRVHPTGMYTRHRILFTIPTGWKATWKTVII